MSDIKANNCSAQIGQVRRSFQDNWDQLGPLTALVYYFLLGLKWLSPITWLSHKVSILKPRSDLKSEDLVSREVILRARWIDCYIFIWWIVECLVCVSCFLQKLDHPMHWLKCLSVVVVLVRILEILQVSINAVLFDDLRGRPDAGQGAKVTRTVVLSGFNYLEFGVCFGVIYAMNLSHLAHAHTASDAFYFSFITQLTIGYGDLFPTHFLRVVSLCQGLAATFFLILTLGRLASFFKVEGHFDQPKNAK